MGFPGRRKKSSQPTLASAIFHPSESLGWVIERVVPSVDSVIKHLEQGVMLTRDFHDNGRTMAFGAKDGVLIKTLNGAIAPFLEAIYTDKGHRVLVTRERALYFIEIQNPHN
jgi:hypothetical protein